MILEGIVTTTDASGGLHLAAMGPAIDEAALRRGRIEWLLLKPFTTSQTAGHLRARPEGVFHLTDDVLLLARIVSGRLDAPPPTRPATAVAGRVLTDACQAYEFVVDSCDDSTERLRLEARVVTAHTGRPFFGFNRAAHAVVEAAILVTRLHLLGTEEVSRQIAALAPLVEKTGGDREREAFSLLATRAMAG
jgi:hypothetical protein